MNCARYYETKAQLTLFPDVVKSYNEDVVKEILNNCIAHSNYQLRGKINILEYIRNSGLDDDIIREFVLKAVITFGEAKTSDIAEAVKGALPATLNSVQQKRKVSNVLQYLKSKGVVEVSGTAKTAKWRIK